MSVNRSYVSLFLSSSYDNLGVLLLQTLHPLFTWHKTSGHSVLLNDQMHNHSVFSLQRRLINPEFDPLNPGSHFKKHSAVGHTSITPHLSGPALCLPDFATACVFCGILPTPLTGRLKLMGTSVLQHGVLKCV